MQTRGRERSYSGEKNLNPVFFRIAERCVERLNKHTGKGMETGCVILDLQACALGACPENLMRRETWTSFLS